MPGVDLTIDRRERLDRPRAGGCSSEIREVVVAQFRGDRAHCLGGIVARPIVELLVCVDDGALLFRFPAPRVVESPQESGVAADEDERARPLRVGRSKEQARRHADAGAEDRRTRRTGCIHHRTHVVHPRLEAGSAAHAIRHPYAALVEDDQPGERRKVLGNATLVRRHLGHELDVRDEARVVDDIERAVAVDAIRDRDVAAASVAGFRLHQHSVARALLPCESGPQSDRTTPHDFRTGMSPRTVEPLPRRSGAGRRCCLPVRVDKTRTLW